MLNLSVLICVKDYIIYIYIYICVCVCRMENRNVRDEEEELKNEEMVVFDECDEEEPSDAPSASAGIVLIHFLL